MLMKCFTRIDAIEAYQTATGAVEDETTGLLKLTSAQFAKLESLFFKIGSVRWPIFLLFYWC